jgi:regulatory protein
MTWALEKLLNLSSVRKQSKQIEDENELYQFALKTLMRRAHSVHELWRSLDRKCSDADMVKRVVSRLRESRYLDDARYAKQFARQHAEGRKQGRFRIQRELRARGVADAHIEAALAEVFAGTDEAAAVRKRIERKLKSHRGPLDQRKIASLYASLLRAGFSGDVVRRELRAASKHAAELPEEEL